MEMLNGCAAKKEVSVQKVPENCNDIRKILCKQMALLAEVSEENKCEPDIVVAVSHEMNEIAVTLFS